MSSGELVAVYNLERTVANFVVKRALDDAVAEGLLPVATESERLTTMREDRLKLLGSLANKTKTEIEPLLDRTAKHAGDRLAPWAVLAMNIHATANRVIGLYSATLPHEIIDAYAEGIEKKWPSVQVEFVMGRELIKDKLGHYTGEVSNAPKLTFLESLIDEGHKIDFVAESWPPAYKAARIAAHHLIVNPEKTPWQMLNLLYWDDKCPFRVRTVNRQGHNERRFNLSESEQRERFQTYFYDLAMAG